jgi:hypothetical protein
MLASSLLPQKAGHWCHDPLLPSLLLTCSLLFLLLLVLLLLVLHVAPLLSCLLPGAGKGHMALWVPVLGEHYQLKPSLLPQLVDVGDDVMGPLGWQGPSWQEAWLDIHHQQCSWGAPFRALLARAGRPCCTIICHALVLLGDLIVGQLQS